MQRDGRCSHLALGRLRSLRGSTQCLRVDRACASQVTLPVVPTYCAWVCTTEQSHRLECFQQELNLLMCSRSSVTLLQPTPLPGLQASVLSTNFSSLKCAPIAPCYLLKWSRPKYSVVGVREPCGGGKPSRPALRSDSTEASNTGQR